MTKRPIKFRAWDKDNKRWLRHNDPQHMIPPRYPATIWDSETDFTFQLTTMLFDIVLCQFTGLHDKNGKEIWEGDVVADADKYDTGEDVSRWVVVYRDGSFWFQNPRDSRNRNTFDWLKDNDCWNEKVIGNIYENPELLN